MISSAPAAAKGGRERTPLSRKHARDRAAAASRQAQEKAARKACLAGDYGAGVDILAGLFVETKDPTHVFNQGRCFEQNRRYEDAIARFQEYLRAGGDKLGPDDTAAAEQHIKSCGELLAQERASTSPPVASQPLAETAATAPQPGALRTEGTSTAVAAQGQPPPASAGRGLRIGGIIAASAGVAALAGGILFNLQANAAIKDMEAKVDGYSPGRKSDYDAYRTLSWVGYGLGAACVVTGAVLYGLGHKARTRSSSSASVEVAFVPAIGVGQVGALVKGTF